MTVWLAPAAQITSNPGEKRISEVFRWHIRVWNQRAPRAEVESDFCLEGFLCGLRQHLKLNLKLRCILLRLQQCCMQNSRKVIIFRSKKNPGPSKSFADFAGDALNQVSMYVANFGLIPMMCLGRLDTLLCHHLAVQLLFLRCSKDTDFRCAFVRCLVGCSLPVRHALALKGMEVKEDRCVQWIQWPQQSDPSAGPTAGSRGVQEPFFGVVPRRRDLGMKSRKPSYWATQISGRWQCYPWIERIEHNLSLPEFQPILKADGKVVQNAWFWKLVDPTILNHCRWFLYSFGALDAVMGSGVLFSCPRGAFSRVFPVNILTSFSQWVLTDQASLLICFIPAQSSGQNGPISQEKKRWTFSFSWLVNRWLAPIFCG